MKAIRTIVATAVIVFALTTVAMAGVQRLGHGADAKAPRRRSPPPGRPPQPGGGDSLGAAVRGAASRRRR